MCQRNLKDLFRKMDRGVSAHLVERSLALAAVRCFNATHHIFSYRTHTAHTQRRVPPVCKWQSTPVNILGERGLPHEVVKYIISMTI
jgi:hypothetical protein